MYLDVNQRGQNQSKTKSLGWSGIESHLTEMSSHDLRILVVFQTASSLEAFRIALAGDLTLVEKVQLAAVAPRFCLYPAEIQNG